MSRLSALVALSLIASPAAAGTYSAKPSTSPAQGRLIARDISWNCGSGICRGSTEESRPLVLCQGLAKRTGKLDSFVANGRAFGPDELAKCNGPAKDGAAALANAN